MYNSNVKYSDLKDFFRAQFVNFVCQKYVKKGYMEMRNNFTLSPEKVHQIALFYTTNTLSAFSKTIEGLLHILQSESFAHVDSGR